MKKFEILQAKLLTEETIKKQISEWRSDGKKIVFTNGCFDIIHRGHIDYLSKAADEGKILIIGLNTDSSVRKLKGPKRPINDELSRALILGSFFFVDAIILFNEETPFNLINTIKPDVLIKGSDYQIEEIVGYDILKSYGGIVKTISFLDGFSTSAIENKIKNQ
ncbi:MAG: D-glycero-beta-D-manno-heptose 1-phosphate adenylyltransferase [Bacteroidetes bacterium]|nr:D-glycero-beta-D-manno-heptose 1-phosphate adenylyltransferase [Bacteroidota bacterium]